MKYTLTNAAQVYNGRTVLNIPDLTITPGEVLALVGPSGAGKSTLLRLLALLEAPAAGQIHLETDNTTYTAPDVPLNVRRRVVMAFQRPVLMSTSVWDNVAYGLRLRGIRGFRPQVDAMLERFGLSQLAQARPQTLSGGELQRAALARALVLNPHVMLLDEPTANLDPANIRLIEEVIIEQQARTGMTLVIVTHNIFQARRLAQRVGLIYEGGLLEVAPTEQFFNTPEKPQTRAFIAGDLIY